jgi:hypothetical protein
VQPRSLILVAFAACACGPASPPKSAAVNLSPSHVSTPAGVTLASACTPTGPETCFNAIDDNCNGVIDEGCGIGTGVLQFTIAWGDSQADVDLVVTDPVGDRIHQGNRTSPSGLRLDRDCPTGCNGQNVENVFFEGNEPTRGHYAVEIKLADPHGTSLPIKVQFGARIGSRTYSAELSLASPDDRKSFAFEL